MEVAALNVSVVITCFNEERNIGPCLESLLEQETVDGTYEIIVADGGSRDKTREEVSALAKDYPKIKLVVEPKPGTAAGRNAGIKASQYDYIAFIDADCLAPADWLSKLIAGFSKTKPSCPSLVAVGGKNIVSDTAGTFAKAIGVVLDSYPGSFGSAQGRQFSKPTYVNSLATLNALYEKKGLLAIGCFDESLLSEGEDAELNYRLYKKGFKFLFLPDSSVWHKMRPTPAGWLKNMFRYGKARARLLKRYPDMWSFSYVLPLLFLLALSLVFFTRRSKLFFLPLLYFPVLLLFSIFHTTGKKTSRLFLHVMGVYLIQHFGYATGELYGLLNPKV